MVLLNQLININSVNSKNQLAVHAPRIQIRWIVRNVCNSLCSPILCVFHLLSLCPPLSTDNTYTLHCVSTCSPVVQFLRVASRCSPTLLTPEVPQPQPTDSSSCRGEGQGRGSLHRHRGTQQDHPSTSCPSESSYGDVCGAVMCEECVWVSVLCPRTANHAMLTALHTLCEPTLY